jgi:hypothetical protein
MTDTVKISCILDTTDPVAALGFEVWIDDQQQVDIDHVTAQQQINLEINDQDADHVLRFVLKNKTTDHTRVDEHGNIVSDARLLVQGLAFDGIPLGQVFVDHAVYTHNYNGTGADVQTKFYGEMGCNGHVELKFSTPIYLWLLEHM